MTSDRPNLRIDADRLWGSLMELAEIGATEKGGVCRIALTDLDRQGRDLFVRWAKAAGATIKIDQLGNIFARREGRDPGKAPIMTGSHLDTQPTGGKFDGAYGVMAGLEVLRVLPDSWAAIDCEKVSFKMAGLPKEDFPAPLLPSTASTSPRWTSRSTSVSADTRP